MAEVSVIGVGMVSALGENTRTSWQNLLAGRSGIKLVSPQTLWGNGNVWRSPDPHLNESLNSPIPLAQIAPDLDLPLAPSRPIALLEKAVLEAIDDAGLSAPLPQNFANCAVIVGSSRSNQAMVENLLQQVQNPESYIVVNSETLGKNWLYSLPASISSYIAQRLGCDHSFVTSTMAACASGNLALAQGYEYLQRGLGDLVVVGATDAAITPLTLAGFKRLGIYSQHQLKPFDRQRDGLVLGEGAAAVILATADFAAKYQAYYGIKPPYYGQVMSWAATNDANHATSSDQHQSMAQEAINQCLRKVGLSPSAIDLISTHGTGTPMNDFHEAYLIQQIFGVVPELQPYISATKGATGHLLGATGLMEAIFLLLTLENQILPPCVGLTEPDFALRLIHETTILERDSLDDRLKDGLNYGLNMSFGFGGQNVAVVFKGIYNARKPQCNA
jgi:3-oxoacyl-[acyl-carrier-protein] synthase II